MKLFHFTCAHSAEQIGRRGILQPNDRAPTVGLAAVVWMTSDSGAPADDLGLSPSPTSICDRMAVRYVCWAPEARPWSEWADRHYPDTHAEMRALLESAGRPETWFVSETPVRARQG